MATIHYKMIIEDSGVFNGDGAAGYPGQNGVVTTQAAATGSGAYDRVGNPTPANVHSMTYPDINDAGDASTPGGNLIQAQKDAEDYAQKYLRRVVIVKTTDGSIAYDTADPNRFVSTVDKQVSEPIFLSEKVGTATVPVVMHP